MAVQLPDSASLERTQEVVDRITRIAEGDPELGGRYQGPPPKPGSTKYPGIQGCVHTVSVAGQSFVLSANGSNFGNLFITLEPFGDPNGSGRTSNQIADDLQKQIDEEVPEAVVKVLGPPPVSGLGSTGGFKFIIEDRSGETDLNKLQKQTDKFIAASKPQVPLPKAELKAGRLEQDLVIAGAKTEPTDPSMRVAEAKQEQDAIAIAYGRSQGSGDCG